MVSTATMAFHYHNAPAPPWLLEIRHQLSITQLQFACITLLVTFAFITFYYVIV